jgi:hypothetical protein
MLVDVCTCSAYFVYTQVVHIFEFFMLYAQVVNIFGFYGCMRRQCILSGFSRLYPQVVHIFRFLWSFAQKVRIFFHEYMHN